MSSYKNMGSSSQKKSKTEIAHWGRTAQTQRTFDENYAFNERVWTTDSLTLLRMHVAQASTLSENTSFCCWFFPELQSWHYSWRQYYKPDVRS